MTEGEELLPHEIAHKFINHTSKHVFLTGKAGTGKTTFLKQVIAHTHKKALVVAPTGIAAINAGGTTIHSLFQLPFGAYLPQEENLDFSSNLDLNLNTPKTLVKHINMRGPKQRLLQELELLIIDEVSMLRADLLDAIDFTLRFVRRKKQQAFGGVQVLFIGDMYQLPPVVKTQEWNWLSRFYPSIYFFDAQVLRQDPPLYIELEKVYRQSDEVFIKLLNNLRNNTVESADLELLQTYYQENFKAPAESHYITLTTHNAKADKINLQQLDALKGKAYHYRSSVEGEFSEHLYPGEKNLTLKRGAQVMFIKNDLNPEKRYFNGKLGIITALDSDEIEVQLADSDVRIKVELYHWENVKYQVDPVSGEIEEHAVGKFTQYPLKLAWAITVHKSQGLTFEQAIIDIGEAFAPGQVYVALSRLRSLEGLKLTSHLRPGGLSVDQNISLFAQRKQEPDLLLQKIQSESILFLHHYLSQSFDLNQLRFAFKTHRETFTKSDKSNKQQQEDWFVAQYLKLKQSAAVADTFVHQLHRLFQPNPVEIEAVHQRVAAALNYFEPILKSISQDFLQKIEQMKAMKGVKAYLGELLELELQVFEQLKKMYKSLRLIETELEGRTYDKQDNIALYDQKKRDADLSKALALTASTGTKTKLKGKKPETKIKVDTKLLSWEMFEEGKSIAELVQLRGLTQATIENHLAYYVATQQLDVRRLLDKSKIQAITDAVESLGSQQLKVLKAHLGDAYSFSDLKFALAALNPTEV